MINLFTYTDDQSVVSDDVPECTDGLHDNEANDIEGQPISTNSENMDDMANWLASDEAAFWMSM